MVKWTGSRIRELSLHQRRDGPSGLFRRENVPFFVGYAWALQQVRFAGPSGLILFLLRRCRPLSFLAPVANTAAKIFCTSSRGQVFLLLSPSLSLPSVNVSVFDLPVLLSRKSEVQRPDITNGSEPGWSSPPQHVWFSAYLLPAAVVVFLLFKICRVGPGVSPEGELAD